MKQIPVHDLIKDKKLLFVDDSIVRGTQLRELCIVENILISQEQRLIWN